MVEPLHLVELAARRLREGSVRAPEVALLPDAAPEPTSEPEVVSTAASDDSLSVPHAPTLTSETLERTGMIAMQERRGRIAEEFRIIAQQVLAGVDAVEGTTAARNLVMVTSACPREGKTFTALNLAASIALGQKRRVVLVDADIQSGSLSSRLSLAGAPGLLDLSSSPEPVAELAWVRSQIDSLSVLPIGGGTDAGARSLISAHYPVAGALTALARRFTQNLFVVDTPPCLSSSDPAAIAAIAGQALLVIEAERTRRPQIEAALDLIDACHTIKLMLNKVRMTTSDTFGTYS